MNHWDHDPTITEASEKFLSDAMKYSWAYKEVPCSNFKEDFSITNRRLFDLENHDKIVIFDKNFKTELHYYENFDCNKVYESTPIFSDNISSEVVATMFKLAKYLIDTEEKSIMFTVHKNQHKYFNRISVIFAKMLCNYVH